MPPEILIEANISLSLSHFQFTFFNNFAVLFHIAFYKQDLPLLRKVRDFSWAALFVYGQRKSLQCGNTSF